MAYVSNQQDGEEPKNPAQGAVPPAGGAGSAGVQLAPSSGVGSVGSSPTPGQPAAGGQFATLDKYITANQGQAEPLANKITSGIGKQYNTLSDQNTSTLGDISSQVTAGSSPSNANAVLAQEAANPVSFANSPFADSNGTNVKNFQNLLTAAYAGPASAEGTAGFTNQQNTINNAIAAGTAATNTEAGRKQLLSQNEAAPSNSVTGLNSAILSQDPNAQSKVENAYKPFSNLLTGLSSGAQGINTNISKAKTDASTTNAAANKQIADQIATFNTGVNTQFGNLQNQYANYNTTTADVAKQLQNGKLPTTAGVDPGLKTYFDNTIGNWMTKYGKTPTYNFANAIPTFTNASAPTLEQAGTAQDYAKAQAFQNLLNGVNIGIAAPVLSPTTASAAGTYAVPTIPNVNSKTLASDMVGSIYPNIVPDFGQLASDPAGYKSFYGLLSSLDKYQGKPWWDYEHLNPNIVGGNTNPNAFNPYSQYTVPIS